MTLQDIHDMNAIAFDLSAFQASRVAEIQARNAKLFGDTFAEAQGNACEASRLDTFDEYSEMLVAVLAQTLAVQVAYVMPPIGAAFYAVSCADLDEYAFSHTDAARATLGTLRFYSFGEALDAFAFVQALQLASLANA